MVLKPFKEDVKLETLPSVFAPPIPAKTEDGQESEQFMDTQVLLVSPSRKLFGLIASLSGLLKIRWLLGLLSLRLKPPKFG